MTVNYNLKLETKNETHFLPFTFYFTSCILLADTNTSQHPQAPQTITILTHDSFAIGEDVITAFETANNAKVVFLQSGDAGAVLNQAILTKDAPLADILFGVDNTFLSRALDADIFEAYQSPALSDISDEYKLDPSNRALPVDYGDVCINYDKNYFTENNLAVPQTFEDLAKPEYKGLAPRRLQGARRALREMARRLQHLRHAAEPARDRGQRGLAGPLRGEFQEEDVVPIVEPEVLMDGSHTLERCAEVTEVVLHEVFQALHRHRVRLEHMLLKPSMVVAGQGEGRNRRRWPRSPLRRSAS